MPSALTTYWVGPTIRPLTVEAKSMLLYFRSADLWGELAARLCRALRQQGILLCCPGDALEPEALVPLPFTAALLHFDRFPDGLPHPDALRACFPGLPLIAVSETEPDSSRFRAIPGTDYELTGRAVPARLPLYWPGCAPGKTATQPRDAAFYCPATTAAQWFWYIPSRLRGMNTP